MLLSLYLLAAVTAVNPAYGVADNVAVTGEAKDGTVICYTGKDNSPCKNAYDPGMQGVVSTNPAISFLPVGGTLGVNMFPVLKSGQANVLVTSVNGAIKTGDYLTSSKTVGVAQKATKNGYILGEALEDYAETDATKIGQIALAVDIRPLVLDKAATANLFQAIREGTDAMFLTPFAMLKYIIAGLILLATTVFGLFNFGKVIKGGVEAIGRNPLAKGTIQFNMILNVLLSIAIIAAGAGIAYVVLII